VTIISIPLPTKDFIYRETTILAFLVNHSDIHIFLHTLSTFSAEVNVVFYVPRLYFTALIPEQTLCWEWSSKSRSYWNILQYTHASFLHLAYMNMLMKVTVK